jgi:hypothetical protein
LRNSVSPDKIEKYVAMSGKAVLAQQGITSTMRARRKIADGLFDFIQDEVIDAVRKVGYDGLLEDISQSTSYQKKFRSTYTKVDISVTSHA